MYCNPNIYLFSNLKNLFYFVKGKTIGVFTKDKFAGDFAGSWKKVFEGGNFEKVLFL